MLNFYQLYIVYLALYYLFIDIIYQLKDLNIVIAFE